MAKQTIEALVEGGKATAAPPLGPALGPLGVNIGQVVSEINKKTDGFKGMQVPVKVTVETTTKAFTITVGTPPASQLLLKEAKIEKASGNPLQDKVANLKIEQIIKISKMKDDALLGKSRKHKVKEIVGTCNSMGIMVEDMSGKDAIKAIDSGKFDAEIIAEKTEISAEELKALEEEKQRLAVEMETRRAEFLSRAKAIIEQMKGKPSGEIKTKLIEAGIPNKIIEELTADETKEKEAAPGAAKPQAAQKGPAAPGAQPAPAAKK